MFGSIIAHADNFGIGSEKSNYRMGSEIKDKKGYKAAYRSGDYGNFNGFQCPIIAPGPVVKSQYRLKTLTCYNARHDSKHQYAVYNPKCGYRDVAAIYY